MEARGSQQGMQTMRREYNYITKVWNSNDEGGGEGEKVVT